MDILYAKPAALALKKTLKPRIAKLAQPPGLDVILVGDNPASQVYVKSKQKMAEKLGLKGRIHHFDATATESELLQTIQKLNAEPSVHGILLQLPLPGKLNAQALLNCIDPKKDVDGLTPTSQGRLLNNLEGFIPCTPLGILKLMEHYAIPVHGQDVVVIGRSALVGRPLALCLMHMGATVTIAHSSTRNLQDHTRSANMIICAAGVSSLIGSEHLQRPCYLIDVGINRKTDGSLCGDMDTQAIQRNPACLGISPVPGGVGKMTIQALMANTVLAAERQQR